MKKGDLYTKHVRGSRYGFSCGKIFYKYPGGQKSYIIGCWESLVDDLIDVRGDTSGGFRVNENKEVVTYKKADDCQWKPYYVGKIDCDMRFEGIEINPTELQPGLLWTGFASHHGSPYHFTDSGKVFFKEHTSDGWNQNTTKYRVEDVDSDLIERLQYLKIHSGRFYMNEHRHVWTPVGQNTIQEFYNNSDIIHIDHIREQFSSLSHEQKNTIQKYSQDRRYSTSGEMWFPIYIGKYDFPIEIRRPEVPHIINSEEDI